MDSFHTYLKKQLLEYVEAERKKGIPLEQIEKVLLDAGHGKNIIDEVLKELEAEQAKNKKIAHSEPVKKDLISQLKSAFSQFMAQASQKEVKEAKKDIEKTDTHKIVEEVIEEAEVIEEKLMLEAFAFFFYLIIIAGIVLFSAGGTDSEILKVIVGFSPSIINAFVSFLAVKLADFVPLYVMLPLAVSSAFYAIGRFIRLPLFEGMDIESLAIVNFLLSFAFNVLIVYVRFVKPAGMKRKLIRKNTKETKREEINRSTSSEYQSHNIRKEIHELKKEFRL